MTPSLRAAVIQEWRGLPERRPSRDRWQPTSQLLPALMQKLGLKERLRESEVIDAWSSIVGDFIAAHSAPVALRTAFSMSACSNQRCTTSSNKFPTQKSCEN